MKRTFGKILSFALVLAMVLSMVPAVLAAPVAGPELYLAPGETARLICKKGTTVGDKTISANAGFWRSDSENVRVTADKAGEATVTAVSSGSSYYGYSATIYAYGKEGDYNSTDYSARKDALMTWRVTVTNWSLTLSTTSNGNSASSVTIAPNATQELTAKVSGPKGKMESVAVAFESSDTGIVSISGADSTSGYKVSNCVLPTVSSTSSKATVTLNATNTNAGNATVSAVLVRAAAASEMTPDLTVGSSKYMYVRDASGQKIEKTLEVKVTGAVAFQLTLDKDFVTLPMRTTAKITPTLTKYNSPVTNQFTFAYESKNISIVRVDSNGNLTPNGVGTTTVEVTVNGLSDSLVKAECTVSVVESAGSGLSIDASNYSTKLALAKGEKFFGVMDVDGTKPTAMIKEFDLTATVASDSSAAERVVWEIPAASKGYIKFTGSNAKSDTSAVGASVRVEMLKSTNSSTATKNSGVVVNATLDGGKTSDTKASYTFVIWQGVAYTIEEAPTVEDPISSVIDTMKDLKTRAVKVKLVKTTEVMYLPIKEVTPERVTSGVNSGKYQFICEIDGKDTDTKTFYFEKDGDGNGTVPTNPPVSISDITIEDQPEASVTYKLDGSSTKLMISAYTNTSGNYLQSFTWYNGQGRAVKTDTMKNRPAYGISELDLSEVITAPGSYSFYCKVTAQSGSVISNISSVSVGGEYFVQINLNNSGTIKPGDVVTATATPQQYNPLTKKYVAVTGKNPTISWTSSDTAIVKVDSTGKSVKVTAVSGGTAKLTAKTTIDGKEYTGTKDITVTVPAAEDVQLMLEEDATYVMLDGGKLSDAVKKATSTTPSTFSFTLPTTGTIYSSSSLSSSISAGNKYSASDVSRMAFKPSRSAGSYTIDYAAYGTSGQIATGKLVIMTNAGTVAYHISANESQTMQVSDFQSVYGSGLSYVRFGTASDSRGALYKGSSTSSGKVGSESYYVSTGTTLLKNVTFIAGSSTAKYSVVIPFTAYGSNGEANGNLVIYVNDTHSVYSTGATFKSMAIADELAPESGASSAYITITRVTGGKLYTQYSKINSCTALAAKDLGSTRFSFSGSNSIDNLYVLPLADSKTVEVNYTINGSDKGTLTFKVVQQTASSKFTDVSGSFKWAANSVDFMYGNGLVNGISTKNPNVFGPGQNMTRAMLVTILYRAAGEPSVAGITNKFTDNKQNQYYYEPVLWASSKGIVNGATATTFDPDGKITREQIAAILYRYAGSPAASSSALNGFADQSAVSSYAVTAMQWAVGNGIITGVSTNGRTTLSAKNNATRAQVSVMLHRFLTMEQ